MDTIQQTSNLASVVIACLCVLSFVVLVNFAYSAIKGVPENE